jgi:ribonuclease HI
VHEVKTINDCDMAASRDCNETRIRFHAHPKLTRMVQIWGGDDRWKPSRSRYYKYVSAWRARRGIAERDRVQPRELLSVESIQRGLQLLSWKEIHKIPGLTTYAAQTLYKLKANKLSLWNRKAQDLTCPHHQCNHLGPTSIQHLFWECPGARTSWNRLRDLWSRLGLRLDSDPTVWLFSLDLPETPALAWVNLQEHLDHDGDSDSLMDQLHPVAQLLWRYMTATTIHGIWCARLRRMEDQPCSEQAQNAVAATALKNGLISLARVMDVVSDDSEIQARTAMMKAYVKTLLGPPLPSLAATSTGKGVYLLFFDGGSRGNPGPGGSGSVIVRVQPNFHEASVEWVASMAYSNPATTNNVAEYWGLIHGLRHAQVSSLRPLHVIGDSATIISQQRRHRPPKNPRLARLYKTSKRIADTIGIQSWTHHYRTHNKMADKAANVAMDTRRSFQVRLPSHRCIDSEITAFLNNDVLHWLVHASEQTSSSSSLRTMHALSMEQVSSLRNIAAQTAGTTPASS